MKAVKSAIGSHAEIASLAREGDSWLSHSSRASLRVLGTVGEPINPEKSNPSVVEALIGGAQS